MARDPKLIILSETLRGQTFVLTADRCTVGRNETCDICIPDPTLSGHHATLLRTGEGGYTVVDEHSTNGTRINGVKVGEQELVDVDIVQFGGVETMYDLGSDRMDGEGREFATRSDVMGCLTPATGEGAIITRRTSVFRPEGIRAPTPRARRLVVPGLAVALLLGLTLLAVLGLLPWLAAVGVAGAVGLAGLAAAGGVLWRSWQEFRQETLIQIAGSLALNSVFVTHGGWKGLLRPLAAGKPAVTAVLAEDFEKLVVIDCRQGRLRGRFHWECFSQYLFGQILAAFGYGGEDGTFHLEDINQLLKDEPRSLFCFLQADLLSTENLNALRSLTQQKHRCLFVFKGNYAGPLGRARKI